MQIIRIRGLFRKNVLVKPGVVEKTGLGESTIYEKIAAGTFPKPVPLGPKAVGWVEEEVDNWIAARVAERDGVGGNDRSKNPAVDERSGRTPCGDGGRVAERDAKIAAA